MKTNSIITKTISITLTIILIIGTIPLTSGAFVYTDENDIKYKEAVDVMSAIGVVDGLTEGSFLPNRFVTRAEATEIITRLMLGRAIADDILPAPTNFSDVPASHWASGYISYCVDQGIITGYSNVWAIVDYETVDTDDDGNPILMPIYGWRQVPEKVKGNSTANYAIWDVVDYEIKDVDGMQVVAPEYAWIPVPVSDDGSGFRYYYMWAVVEYININETFVTVPVYRRISFAVDDGFELNDRIWAVVDYDDAGRVIYGWILKPINDDGSPKASAKWVVVGYENIDWSFVTMPIYAWIEVPAADDGFELNEPYVWDVVGYDDVGHVLYGWIAKPVNDDGSPKDSVRWGIVEYKNIDGTFITVPVYDWITIPARDGSFNPDDYVTASQFAAMLLSAAGYGKQGEYTGIDWELNAILDGIDVGILAGVEDSVDFTKPATLEELMQYCFNALLINHINETAPFSVNIQSKIDKKTKFNGKETLTVSFQLQSNLPDQTIQNTQGLRLTYDNTLLQLIRWDATSAINEPIAGAPLELTAAASGKAGVLGSIIQVYSAKSLLGSKGFISISLTDSNATYKCTFGEYVTLGEVRFAFRPGKNASDLNEDSIRIMETDELYALNQSCAVVINDVQGVIHTYGKQKGGIAIPEADDLDKPTFTWIIPSGAIVTGIVKSYNPKHETTISLMQGDVEAYMTIIAATAGSGLSEQEFTIEDVAPGTYDLVISKLGHTPLTVKEIFVGNKDIDLALDSRLEVRLMALRCGDIDGDGMINDIDLTHLWMLVNYNRKTSDAANPLCDLNGDGMINDMDLTILWMAYNYNRGPVIISESEQPYVTQLAFVISFDYYLTLVDNRIVQVFEAVIVDLNGVVHTVPTTANMFYNSWDFIGKVCSFSITQNRYAFFALSDTSPTLATDGTYIVEPRVEEIRNKDSYLYPSFGLSVQRANSLTKFVVVNYNNDGEPDGTVDVVTGINAVKNYLREEGKFFAVSYNVGGAANNIADIIYIFDEVASIETSKLVYVCGSYYEDSDGIHVSVIIEGKIEEIVVGSKTDELIVLGAGKLLAEASVVGGATQNMTGVLLGPDIFLNNLKVENIGGIMQFNGASDPLGDFIADGAPVYIITYPAGKPAYSTVQSLQATYFSPARAYANAWYYLDMDGCDIVAVYIISET